MNPFEQTGTCLNCCSILQEHFKFCPECGQTSNTPRITRKMMWQEFLRVYLNIDKGLIYTVKQLAAAPGKTPLDFVQGKRVRFMKPLTFLTIISAVSAGAVRHFTEDFSPWFHLYEVPGKLLSVIPIGAILSSIIIRDKRYNFWERATLHGFISFAFLVLLSIGCFLLPDALFNWFILALPPIFAMYTAVAYWQFYEMKRPVPLIRGTIAAGLLTILLIKMVQ
jgi:hypothetical protein